jgi:AraC family transcriptional regulator
MSNEALYESSKWSGLPRWYLWDGGFLAVGRSQGVVPPHAHHAIQIVIGVEGAMAIADKNGEWRSARAIIVRADVQHSYDGQGAYGAMLFVDPESMEGRWLRSSLTADITVVPDSRLEGCVGELRTFAERPFESMEIGSLIRHCVQSLCTGAPPARRLDPRVSVVLKAIRASDDLRISLEAAAATVFLSPGRFAHLFKRQVGLPFRRYILWRKLTRAVLAIGREGTIAAAAQAADFADAAHLTRTFYQMFGIPPSVMMRGDFFEIKPPFELTVEGQ